MILSALKTITTKIKLKIAPERAIYVVTDGVYKGEWLVRVRKANTESVFLSLPDKQTRIIPNKDFNWGLANKVIEVVEVLPKSVFNVVIAHYGTTQDTNVKHHPLNRRKQHSPQDSLDS